MRKTETWTSLLLVASSLFSLNVSASIPFLLSSQLPVIPNSTISTPAILAIDSQSNVYVYDQVKFVVKKYKSNGQYLSQFGGPGQGLGQFDYVMGMVVDNAGNLFVASHNTDAQKCSPSMMGGNGFNCSWILNSGGARGITLSTSNEIYLLHGTGGRP
jgi:hypothetical protein